ncbi:MAG: DEAD/DEAH box helicase, partial [Propionibacteriaceae bacterium]|nr:DEAD/DEAH box helicase [Propionibacteriaceae bacterium]
MSFHSFFMRATGNAPYDYQVGLAANGLPPALEVPTGAGKTAAIVLAWLYRLTEARIPGTPRSLVFMLPMRTLVEQTAESTKAWLENVGLSGQVRVVTLMGGNPESSGSLNEWRRNPQQPTVVIGTVDSVLSRALVRGYAQPRPSYPIDFARITDDAHWVLDEVQLAQQAAATARQVASFRDELETLHPGRLTCMSATLPSSPLNTIDNPYQPDLTVTLGENDRSGSLRIRLEATRTIRSIP